MFPRASPSALLPHIEVSSARSRESLGTSCSSVAGGSYHTEGPFLFALVQLAAVLEEPKVRFLSHQYPSHSFFKQVPSLMLVAQVVYHPHLYLHPCSKAAGASHDSPRAPNVHISGSRRFKNTTKIKGPPRERRKKENCGGRGKKRTKFWAVQGKGGPGRAVLGHRT